MAQAMYVHPTGEPCTPRGFAFNRKVTIPAIFKQARKLLYKDIGDDWERLDIDKYTVDEDRIVYWLTNNGVIVVDRKANALGR